MRFVGGVYRPDGAVEVKRQVKALLRAANKTKLWTSRIAEEVVEYIRVDARSMWERPSTDRLNVTNGLLNLGTGELSAHSPDFLSPIQLPVAYDPSATCPAWDLFVEQVFPADAQQVAYEVPAWLIIPDVSHQKALLLVGEGANGKSTYLTALRAFLGARNVSGVSLNKLESDRFAAARLVGKLANICPDLPSAGLEGTSTFKQITGGDTITAEYKFRDSFDYEPFARLVFSANQPPRSADATHAFFRRWLVVPFARTFEPAEQIPRHELDARLAAPAELSGVLNRALEARRAINDHGLTESESMRTAWGEFRSVTDPLATWLDFATAERTDGFVLKHALLNAYNETGRRQGRPPVTATAFGTALKRLRPNLQDKQRTAEGRVQWGYLGIELVPHALHEVH